MTQFHLHENTYGSIEMLMITLAIADDWKITMKMPNNVKMQSNWKINQE